MKKVIWKEQTAISSTFGAWVIFTKTSAELVISISALRCLLFISVIFVKLCPTYLFSVSIFTLMAMFSLGGFHKKARKMVSGLTIVFLGNLKFYEAVSRILQLFDSNRNYTKKQLN